MENCTYSEFLNSLSKQLNDFIDIYIKKIENNEKLSQEDLIVISRLLYLAKTS